ncbi:MAG: nitrilase, partial [Thermotoga sp.]
MKVGVLQFKPEFMRIEENLNRIKSMVEKFDGDVLILPELTFSG